MAKRKSLTTTDAEESTKRKKVKLEEPDESSDELDGSQDELEVLLSSALVGASFGLCMKTDTMQVDTKGVKVHSTPEGDKYVDLGKNKRACVRSFKGKTLIDIREFYADKDSGELKPGKKGISLPVDQWEELKKAAQTIDELIIEKK
ncbi:transcriptional Coactivator p15-domain-containing protein [Mycena crocata]|nr:transcriptional Coactivator p15-domain-containing protein [Mycena crocata]